MSSKTRKKRKVKKITDPEEPDEVKLAPHSFVICRGDVSKNITSLMQSMRKVMLPYTAASLVNSKKNCLKDYVAVAGPMHVSHLVIFSQTKLSPIMKIVKLPNGPTVYFRINKFSTINDVLTNVEGASLGDKLFHYQPLVAVNNFDYSQPHHVIVSSMFQNMFPKLNISQLNLKKIKRCVLFNYDTSSDNGIIEFRQYRIKLLAPDLTRSVRKLMSGKVNVNELNKYQDIADYVTKSGNMSAGSDVELTQIVESANPTSASGEDSTGVVTINGTENDTGSGEIPKRKKLKSKNRLAVRLVEFGPRMQLQLYKIEQGICEGEILYHSVFTKSAEEKDLLIEKHRLNRKRPKHQFTEQNPNRPEQNRENDSKAVKQKHFMSYSDNKNRKKQKVS